VAEVWGTVAFDFHIGPDGPLATLSRSVVTGDSRLTIEGNDVPRAATPDRPFLVPLHDGKSAIVTVKARGYDYMPQVFVDGTEIRIGRPLALWEYVLAGLPILLLFVGGFIGVIVGFGAMALNQWLLRSLPSRAYGVGAALAVLVLSYIVVQLLVAAARQLLSTPA